jgi:hypothetical protein
MALNLSTTIISNDNAKYLEPKEVKTLTDIVLNLEDSITIEDTEGKFARKTQRILDKYGLGVKDVTNSQTVELKVT